MTDSQADISNGLSVVIPMHNEGASTTSLFDRLLPILDGLDIPYEVVCVDDGSTDDTVARLQAARRANKAIRLVELSRNFGKEPALMAGIDQAAGAAVVVMDADLQDPPELIADFVAKWRDGFEMVYGARRSRDADSWPKRITARLFYYIFNQLVDTHIPADAGDFRLLDRRVVTALQQMPERARFMKGIFAWVGFRQAAIPFDRPGRHAGSSQFSYFRLFRFALDGIFSFSTIPLRISTWIGVIISSFAFFYTLYFFVRTLIYGADLPGYPSLIIAVMFLGGIQLLSIGLLGEYIGRIFAEAKDRPLYVVRQTQGFEDRPRERGPAGTSESTDSS